MIFLHIIHIKMRGLRDFKVPDFKFPKFKMKDIPEIDEVNVDYEAIRKAQENQKKKEIKEKEFILEKFDSKGKYTQISYEQFGKDVIGFGTSLTRKLKLDEKARILIISETTYDWYVAYMTVLCGKGIAVPTDKELPDHELENVF